MDVSTIQRELSGLGFYAGPFDGVHDERTDDAIEGFLRSQQVEHFEDWPDKRQQLAALQAITRLRGIEVGKIDGLMGPQTRHAIDVYDARARNGWQPVAAVEAWRDDPALTPPVEPSHPLPGPSAKLKPPPIPGGAWPKQSRMTEFFGAVGTRQATLLFPFQMRLAWDPDTAVRKASCHTKCKEHFEFIWESTLKHYGLAEIKRLRLDLYGGLLNVRKMRGGSAWSMHAWGTAQDVDPDRNQLKWGRDRATLSRSDYDPFWSIVYATGAISLGRERNYDFMHFQLALL